MTAQPQAIRHTFALSRKEKMRHRDIAQKLNISEAELISAHVGMTLTSDNMMEVSRLRDNWPAIIEALTPLGDVLALTRNPDCVHEKTGTYRDASHNGMVGLVLGEIDLRVFYTHWAFGFVVKEKTEHGIQQSLQFYDKAGDAIHKIFLKKESNEPAFHDLVAQFQSDITDPVIHVVPYPAPAPEKPDTEIDTAGFRQAWAELTDTHQFFGMLKKFNVSRTQALRLADLQFVRQIEANCAQTLLETAVQQQVSIMVFVGNHGMIQIHTGEVHQIAVMGPWVNVLDPRFNLHLKTDAVHSAWIVKKPTSDGIVTSVELFDAAGNVIAMFFGERKPGKPELASWTALVEDLALKTEVTA